MLQWVISRIVRDDTPGRGRRPLVAAVAAGAGKCHLQRGSLGAIFFIVVSGCLFITRARKREKRQVVSQGGRYAVRLHSASPPPPSPRSQAIPQPHSTAPESMSF